MKIHFFSTHPYDKQYFEANNKFHTINFTEVQLNEDTVLQANGSNVVCTFVNDILNRKVLQSLANMEVKLIALRCAGYNNVDLLAAKEYGITVVRVPAYSPHAVAEHTLALILTLNRKIHKAYNRVSEGNFSLDRLMGFDIYGKTVGVIGTGKIGAVFCNIMLGLGCEVLAYDLFPQDDLIKKGILYTELNILFQQSDIISLHCPLNETTHQIINTESLQLMKKGVMLINTGRGGLIHSKAVIQALKSKHLGYLGLDVYDQEEKLFFRDLSEYIIQDEVLLRLMSFPNVLITAHQGFFTHEAMTEIANTTLENIAAFEQGLDLKNKVS